MPPKFTHLARISHSFYPTTRALLAISSINDDGKANALEGFEHCMKPIAQKKQKPEEELWKHSHRLNLRTTPSPILVHFHPQSLA
ncbi:hypothetical protein Cflav_PD0120 [Pedosphaera parvula Ellin514]|uniref:Uncharacterized protein n=1 Tax=Pedosphaera parvula (strain Ellin514) TaxID=320771 RepID=B9XSU8_PEDPL|nr:hypothetical protein Cflav_PD0120 [Pedosphaera parvula Ellin514]